MQFEYWLPLDGVAAFWLAGAQEAKVKYIHGTNADDSHPKVTFASDNIMVKVHKHVFYTHFSTQIFPMIHRHGVLVACI